MLVIPEGKGVEGIRCLNMSLQVRPFVMAALTFRSCGLRVENNAYLIHTHILRTYTHVYTHKLTVTVTLTHSLTHARPPTHAHTAT